MAKEIKFNIEARDLMKKGVDELANAVKVTLILPTRLRYKEVTV